MSRHHSVHYLAFARVEDIKVHWTKNADDGGASTAVLLIAGSNNALRNFKIPAEVHFIPSILTNF